AAMRGRHLVAALARRVGAFLDVTPASRAPGRPPLGQGEHPGHVLLAPLRLPSGDRADEAPLLVVLVYGLLGRLPAVEAARADTEPLGRLYAGSEARIREAAGEKGMSTSRRFSDHAAFARSSNCLLVSRSLSSRSQSSSSSWGSTTERRISAGKN